MKVASREMGKHGDMWTRRPGEGEIGRLGGLGDGETGRLRGTEKLVTSH